MENTKKSIPISSIFFILYFVANVVRVILNVISTIQTYSSMGAAGVATAPNAIAPTIIVNIFVILPLLPFLLMGFFTFKTNKKPSIGYIVCLVLSLVGPFVAVLGSIANVALAFATKPDLQMISTLSTFITQPLLFVALIFALAYAIIAKVFKKPSKFFNFWFLFPIPFAIFFIAQVAASIINILLSFRMSATSLGLYICATLLFVIGFLFLTVAFFTVSNQFAKANKSLPVADEITQTAETTE